MTKFNVELDTRKFILKYNSLTVDISTKIGKKLFKSSRELNELFFFIKLLGLELSFGTKRLKISFNGSMKKIFLIILLDFIMQTTR